MGTTEDLSRTCAKCFAGIGGGRAMKAIRLPSCCVIQGEQGHGPPSSPVITTPLITTAHTTNIYITKLHKTLCCTLLKQLQQNFTKLYTSLHAFYTALQQFCRISQNYTTRYNTIQSFTNPSHNSTKLHTTLHKQLHNILQYTKHTSL
jgi:hypothetical protein